jgi:tetratricopeptide (TPR) repeat protein
MRGILETKGLILVMQGDDISAEQIFRSLIKEYGVNCPTLSGLGYIANARKDYETAKKYFEDALKQPDIIPADTSPINDKAIILLGLAWVNANEHKYKEAISCYQKILKEEPIAVFALVGMGDAYTQLGEYAKAEVYFKRALAINSEFPVQLNREPLKEKESKI